MGVVCCVQCVGVWVCGAWVCGVWCVVGRLVVLCGVSVACVCGVWFRVVGCVDACSVVFCVALCGVCGVVLWHAEKPVC